MQTEFMKKANAPCEFSPYNIQELKRCTEDPIYFIRNYIKVQHPTKGSIPFDLYPYQEAMIRDFQNNRYNITLQARQSGKTTTIAAFLLWYTCFQFDKTVLVASNKNSNAMEIMARVIYAYEELPHWLKPGTKYATKHSMEFDNGSRIFSEATTESTGRGKSLSLLMLDELAFVPKRIQEEMWVSVQPTFSTGGGCIISSTPNGDSDLFAELWTGAKLGINGFNPVFVHWSDHPDRDDQFKRDQIGQIGELRWRQEFECELLSNDPLLISSITLQNIKPAAPIHEDRGVKFWSTVKSDSTYYVGVDIATGVEADFATIQILEFPSMIQFAEFRSNKVNIQQLYSRVKWVLNYLLTCGNEQKKKPPEVYWSFENNGVGAAFGTLYQNDETFPDAVLLSDQNRLGIATTSRNKILSCIELKNLVEKKNTGIKIHSDLLITELKNYISTGKSYAAKRGSTDDLIAAMLVIIQLLQRAAQFEPEVFNTMYSYDDHYNEENDESGFGDEPMPMVF